MVRLAAVLLALPALALGVVVPSVPTTTTSGTQGNITWNISSMGPTLPKFHFYLFSVPADADSDSDATLHGVLGENVDIQTYPRELRISVPSDVPAGDNYIVAAVNPDDVTQWLGESDVFSVTATDSQ